jgi:hypothetical protein
VEPSARLSRTTVTGMRVPETQTSPPRTCGLLERWSANGPHLHGTGFNFGRGGVDSRIMGSDRKSCRINPLLRGAGNWETVLAGWRVPIYVKSP